MFPAWNTLIPQFSIFSFMSLPTLPATKYAWAAAIMTGSLAITVPLLYSNHPWAFGFVHLLITTVLSWQLLLQQLPYIMQARGLMHLNIRKGDSLLLHAPPSKATRKRRAPRAPR